MLSRRLWCAKAEVLPIDTRTSNHKSNSSQEWIDTVREGGLASGETPVSTSTLNPLPPSFSYLSLLLFLCGSGRITPQNETLQSGHASGKSRVTALALSAFLYSSSFSLPLHFLHGIVRLMPENEALQRASKKKCLFQPVVGIACKNEQVITMVPSLPQFEPKISAVIIVKDHCDKRIQPE